MPAEQYIHDGGARTMMPGVSKIHLIGAGGAGMCGIAEALHSEGYQVSGSDILASATTERLSDQGIKVNIGHAAGLVESADVVVVSSAIPKNNPEASAAKAQHIPVLSRAQMLVELMRYRYSIAVAGTHGKTTTAGFSAEVLILAGRAPSFVIGGLLKQTNSHAQIGRGPSIVVEADESDRSFLDLRPVQAIVTSIDQDHIQGYGDSFEHLLDAFVAFLGRLPFYGSAIVCGDDPGVRMILPRLKDQKVITYGFDQDNDFCAEDYHADTSGCRFKVTRPRHEAPLAVRLPVSGHHNARNALAAITLASVEQVSDEALLEALATSQGVCRRFALYTDVQFAGRRIDLVDDYGHHPTALSAILSTVREIYPKRRLLLAFQLHRYSRTEAHFDHFVCVLNEADALLIQEIYSAGEAPIAGMDGAHLCAAIAACGKQQPHFAQNPDEALAQLGDLVASDDVLVVLGAGDISDVAQRILKDQS